MGIAIAAVDNGSRGASCSAIHATNTITKKESIRTESSIIVRRYDFRNSNLSQPLVGDRGKSVVYMHHIRTREPGLRRLRSWFTCGQSGSSKHFRQNTRFEIV